MYLLSFASLSLLLLLFSTTLKTQVNASPLRTAINASIPNANNPAVCVNSREWSTPSLFPKDCIDAAMRLNHEEVVQYRWQDFEFLAHGAARRTRLPVQETPRRFTYSKSPEDKFVAGEREGKRGEHRWKG